jgi:hypothetical protein
MLSKCHLVAKQKVHALPQSEEPARGQHAARGQHQDPRPRFVDAPRVAHRQPHNGLGAKVHLVVRPQAFRQGAAACRGGGGGLSGRASYKSKASWNAAVVPIPACVVVLCAASPRSVAQLCGWRESGREANTPGSRLGRCRAACANKRPPRPAPTTITVGAVAVAAAAGFMFLGGGLRHQTGSFLTQSNPVRGFASCQPHHLLPRHRAKKMEEAGFEPATYSLQTKRATTAPFPRGKMPTNRRSGKKYFGFKASRAFTSPAPNTRSTSGGAVLVEHGDNKQMHVYTTQTHAHGAPGWAG